MTLNSDGARPGFRSPTSLVDEAVRVITNRIVEGELTPGTRLVEEHLAREFGISRPPIRESFRALEREGLVTISPRRGVRVRQLTADEVRDIYVCRAALRGLAARIATQHMAPEILTELEAVLMRMEQSAATSNVASYQRDVGRFNEIVVTASRNETLKELLHTLTLRAQVLSFTALSAPGRMDDSLHLHTEVFNAFKRGDAETAEHRAKQSLEDSIPVVLAHLQASAVSSQPDGAATPPPRHSEPPSVTLSRREESPLGPTSPSRTPAPAPGPRDTMNRPCPGGARPRRSGTRLYSGMAERCTGRVPAGDRGATGYGAQYTYLNTGQIRFNTSGAREWSNE